MRRTSEQLITEILSLPAQSRAYLAEKLIESLDLQDGSELDSCWRDEVVRRCREIDEGRAELIPSEQAFQRVISAIS